MSYWLVMLNIHRQLKSINIRVDFLTLQKCQYETCLSLHYHWKVIPGWVTVNNDYHDRRQTPLTSWKRSTNNRLTQNGRDKHKTTVSRSSHGVVYSITHLNNLSLHSHRQELISIDKSKKWWSAGKVCLLLHWCVNTPCTNQHTEPFSRVKNGS